MRNVTYSMAVSLDGYVTGPDGSFQWTTPSPEVFQHSIDEIRDVGVHLLGRRLYETMLYWETAAEDPDLTEPMRLWASLWNPLPKVVFSRTLTSVVGNARLATGSVREEIERLRVEPDEGNIAIGGPTLAAQAVDLIDEFHVRLCPAILGGGTPYFPRPDHQLDLELVETRTFDSGVVYLHHRVKR